MWCFSTVNWRFVVGWWAGWYAAWCEQEQLEEDSPVWRDRAVYNLTTGHIPTIVQRCSHQHHTLASTVTTVRSINQPSTSTSRLQIIKSSLYALDQSYQGVKISNIYTTAAPTLTSHLIRFVFFFNILWMTPADSWPVHLQHILAYFLPDTVEYIEPESGVDWQNDKPDTGSPYTSHKEPWHEQQWRLL